MRTTVSVVCSHPDCHEKGRYGFDTKKEAREWSMRKRENWTCTRHSLPDEVLSIRRIEITTVLESKHIEGLSELFWIGSGKSGNGFAHGTGYRAWAKDFPEGTKLEVTARIILPS